MVWDNCTHYEKEELEKTQNEAARIVLGTTKLVSVHALYEEIVWDTLESRRRKHKLTLFYKMYTNKTPSYLSTLVLPSVNILSEYSLRNSNDTQTVHARTILYLNSFIPSTVREWNNLPLECRNSDC